MNTRPMGDIGQRQGMQVGGMGCGQAPLHIGKPRTHPQESAVLFPIPRWGHHTSAATVSTQHGQHPVFHPVLERATPA
jgi:hypothetical protein